jgi:hypothetical protein
MHKDEEIWQVTACVKNLVAIGCFYPFLKKKRKRKEKEKEIHKNEK